MRILTNVNIEANMLEKIGDSYLIEYKEYCKENKQKESIDIIIQWLKEINKKYKSD
jgi:hypothetical protein